MAGKIKSMIDMILVQRSHGNATILSTTKTKILLKGINPDSYSASSEDDPLVMAKVRKIAEEFNIQLAI
jgi:hypothetical protein